MAFGDELKRIRKERNISQQELANNIYVSRSAIAKWENGLGLPSEDNIEQLVNYFGVDRDTFFPKIEEEEIVEKNKKKRKRRLILSIIGEVIFVLFLALCITAIVVVSEHPDEFGADRKMMIDGYYAFIDEEKVIAYPGEYGKKEQAWLLYDDSASFKEEHSDRIYEVNTIGSIEFTNRFWFFTDFKKVEYQMVFLGTYDLDNNLLDAGAFIIIKDSKGMYNYFYYVPKKFSFSITVVRADTVFIENPYITINGNDIVFENDYYFKSEINLLDEGLDIKVNGASVNVYEHCPEYYYLNEPSIRIDL